MGKESSTPMVATRIQTANLPAIWSEFQTTQQKKKMERKTRERMDLSATRVKREMRPFVGHAAGMLIKMFIHKNMVFSIKK